MEPERPESRDSEVKFLRGPKTDVRGNNEVFDLGEFVIHE